MEDGAAASLSPEHALARTQTSRALRRTACTRWSSQQALLLELHASELEMVWLQRPIWVLGMWLQFERLLCDVCDEDLHQTGKDGGEVVVDRLVVDVAVELPSASVAPKHPDCSPSSQQTWA